MKHKLTGTRVLLKFKKAEQKTEGGIFLPGGPTIVPLQGTVERMGPDVSIGILVMDEDLYDRFAGTQVELDGNSYLIVDEADILLIFVKEQ